MNIKQTLIGLFAVMLTFGFVGSAFAAESGLLHLKNEVGAIVNNAEGLSVFVQEGSEAGYFTLAPQKSPDKSSVAKNDPVYIEDGSEAGDWLIKCGSC